MDALRFFRVISGYRTRTTWPLHQLSTKLVRKTVGVAMLLTIGCADVAMQSSTISRIQVLQPSRFQVVNTIKGESSAGYDRTLRQGSRWIELGTIAQGTVYQPQNNVLTVEGLHVREAYIVVRDSRWIGFWLPNEEAFSPVHKPVPIELVPIEERS